MPSLSFCSYIVQIQMSVSSSFSNDPSFFPMMIFPAVAPSFLLLCCALLSFMDADLGVFVDPIDIQPMRNSRLLFNYW